MERRHSVIVAHLEAVAHVLVDGPQRLCLTLLALGRDVDGELVLEVGQHPHQGRPVRQPEGEKRPQGLDVGVPLPGQQVEDGVAMGVPAVDGLQSCIQAVRHVVDDLHNVGGHDCVVHDGGDLEGGQFIIVEPGDAGAHSGVGTAGQPLEDSVDLSEVTAGLRGPPLGAEDGEDGVLVRQLV